MLTLAGEPTIGDGVQSVQAVQAQVVHHTHVVHLLVELYRTAGRCTISVWADGTVEA